jgi:3-hydroxybutyryl-CoA dehydratase
MTKTAARMEYADLSIGQERQFGKKITKRDILKFAELTGDYNPLHVDETYGRDSTFGTNIAHGMLAGSLFSTLIGMYLPGEASLYLGQTLRFRKPIFPGDELVVKGCIINRNDSLRIITMKMEILKRDGEDVAIDGEAKVQCLR